MDNGTKVEIMEEVVEMQTGVVQLCNCRPTRFLTLGADAYLIFVISFTQTGFSKTKFYTQKND